MYPKKSDWLSDQIWNLWQVYDFVTLLEMLKISQIPG